VHKKHLNNEEISVTDYCNIIDNPKSEERAHRRVNNYKLSGIELEMTDFFQVIGTVLFVVQVVIIIYCWQPSTNKNSSQREIVVHFVEGFPPHNLCFEILNFLFFQPLPHSAE
jgi:hypothetical protein